MWKASWRLLPYYTSRYSGVPVIDVSTPQRYYIDRAWEIGDGSDILSESLLIEISHCIVLMPWHAAFMKRAAILSRIATAKIGKTIGTQYPYNENLPLIHHTSNSGIDSSFGSRVSNCTIYVFWTFGIDYPKINIEKHVTYYKNYVCRHSLISVLSCIMHYVYNNSWKQTRTNTNKQTLKGWVRQPVSMIDLHMLTIWIHLQVQHISPRLPHHRSNPESLEMDQPSSFQFGVGWLYEDFIKVNRLPHQPESYNCNGACLFGEIPGFGWTDGACLSLAFGWFIHIYSWQEM